MEHCNFICSALLSSSVLSTYLVSSPLLNHATGHRTGGKMCFYRDKYGRDVARRFSMLMRSLCMCELKWDFCLNTLRILNNALCLSITSLSVCVCVCVCEGTRLHICFTSRISSAGLCCSPTALDHDSTPLLHCHNNTIDFTLPPCKFKTDTAGIDTECSGSGFIQWVTYVPLFIAGSE